MKPGKIFVVGMAFALSTMALAVNTLSAGFDLPVKVKDFCEIYKNVCVNSGGSTVGPDKRVPILTCYCGSRGPILVKIINDPSQITSEDKEKLLIKLSANSTIGGMPAQYMLIEDAGFANFLASEGFSYVADVPQLKLNLNFPAGISR
ncbi:hypothetical protein HLB42_07710 [Deinococcus sp. D7000]|nr:hypothetical protein HLB42_07710 [Deinococcus sp. D7000]